MHPILFRIPLPKAPLQLWWALAAVALVAALYAVVALRKTERRTACVALLVSGLVALAAFRFKDVSYSAPNLPIYSYGVMLGLSLVAGWFVSLTLAEREGLPREVIGNCYVVTAMAAIVGARFLYVVTNPDEFKTAADLLALRKGGLVAYGGFIGGFVGSWAYLRSYGIRLLPWADVAVPSLALGLGITRIGCYLYGCDFGQRLSEKAPSWLQKLGTFPEWSSDALDTNRGSPAFLRHIDLFRGTPLEAQLHTMKHSFPVHPTQIYESIVGLLLLVSFFALRKRSLFRGHLFFLFVFAYGFLRFLIEIVRDDPEREAWGPVGSIHVFIPIGLLVFAVAFAFGPALSFARSQTRNAIRALMFVPATVAYLWLKPASFATSAAVRLSVSQWVALVTTAAASWAFAHYWQMSRKNPKLAMSLGDGDVLVEATTAKDPPKETSEVLEEDRDAS